MEGRGRRQDVVHWPSILGLGYVREGAHVPGDSFILNLQERRNPHDGRVVIHFTAMARDCGTAMALMAIRMGGVNQALGRLLLRDFEQIGMRAHHRNAVRGRNEVMMWKLTPLSKEYTGKN